MKTYNFKLAKTIIDTLHKLDILESASLGMHEDWFLTGKTIWSNNTYTVELLDNADELEAEFQLARKNGLSTFLEEDETGFPKVNPEYERLTKHRIQGLYSSIFATPVLEVEFKDGTNQTFFCYKKENTSSEDILSICDKIEKSIQLNQGCLSGPIQTQRINTIIKEFKY